MGGLNFVKSLIEKYKGEKEVIEKPNLNNNKKEVIKIKKETNYIFDQKLQKKIEKEEMKIAKKIAKEFFKDNSKTTLKNNEESDEELGYYRSGIEGFDKLLLSGGLTIPSSTLVEGGPGSGKTIFCLHVAMDFCKRGKTVLYMTFEESEERLAGHMSSFGFDTKKYIDNGQLIIKRFNALDIARSVEALLSEAKKELLIEVQPILIPQEIDPDLVLVDSLTSIASAFSGEDSRFRIYMEQLFRYLEDHKISALLIREVANPGHVGGGAGTRSDEATSFLSDGIIIFYNVIYDSGKRTRAVEILKLRGQEFDRKIVEADILKGIGLKVYPDKVLKGKYTLT